MFLFSYKHNGVILKICTLYRARHTLWIPYVPQIIRLVFLPRYATCTSGNTTEKSEVFFVVFFIHHAKYFYGYIVNHKCFFFRIMTIFFLDINHQVEHVLPGSKSYQENTTKNLFDLNAPLLIIILPLQKSIYTKQLSIYLAATQ